MLSSTLKKDHWRHTDESCVPGESWFKNVVVKSVVKFSGAKSPLRA